MSIEARPQSAAGRQADAKQRIDAHRRDERIRHEAEAARPKTAGGEAQAAIGHLYFNPGGAYVITLATVDGRPSQQIRIRRSTGESGCVRVETWTGYPVLVPLHGCTYETSTRDLWKALATEHHLPV